MCKLQIMMVLICVEDLYWYNQRIKRFISSILKDNARRESIDLLNSVCFTSSLVTPVGN